MAKPGLPLFEGAAAYGIVPWAVFRVPIGLMIAFLPLFRTKWETLRVREVLLEGKGKGSVNGGGDLLARNVAIGQGTRVLRPLL